MTTLKIWSNQELLTARCFLSKQHVNLSNLQVFWPDRLLWIFSGPNIKVSLLRPASKISAFPVHRLCEWHWEQQNKWEMIYETFWKPLSFWDPTSLMSLIYNFDFFFSLLYPSSQTPPQTRSSLGGNVWLFKSQRSMCITLRISAGFPLLFKSVFPIDYGFNQPLDNIHSQIHHVWNEWEQGPQGSGHNTNPVRVQETFGQDFQAHGVILGTSCRGPGVGLWWFWWIPSNSAYFMITVPVLY